VLKRAIGPVKYFPPQTEQPTDDDGIDIATDEPSED
jgi:hypothetical protein